MRPTLLPRAARCVALLALAVAMLPVWPANAGPFTLAWARPGGGGLSSQGPLALLGSAGQPFSSTTDGGRFRVLSGVWTLDTLPTLIDLDFPSLVVPEDRSIRLPLDRLTAGDRSVLGYRLVLQAMDGTTEAGGTLTRVGAWVVYQPPAGPVSEDRFGYTVSDGHEGARHARAGTVTLVPQSMSPEPPPGPNSAAIARSGADLVLTFIGVPGRTYRVQYTASPMPPYTWHDAPGVPDHTAPANGVFIHLDPAPADAFRLYRAVAVGAVRPEP